ncbi:hypothetical protein [Algoriphagus boritolerans]|uniref:hypothetical protein n=1 Tax=Algoriphagus boritolerans TaxID=308111 RepID=UPI000AA58067
MGLSKLVEITRIYKRLGKCNLPIAIIQNGTRTNQREVIGTIQSIVELSQKEKIGGPAVLVIGEVVNLPKSKNSRPKAMFSRMNLFFKTWIAFLFDEDEVRTGEKAKLTTRLFIWPF